jgi:4-hydroxybenzoate polyprenyltransferase
VCLLDANYQNTPPRWPSVALGKFQEQERILRSRATKTPPGVTALWIVVAIVTYMAIDSIRWGYTLGWFLLIGVLPFIAIFIYSIFKEKKPPREDRKYVPKWEPTII